MERPWPIVAGNAIVQNEGMQPELIEKCRDLLPFVVVGEKTITPAGANNNGLAVGLLLWSEVNRQSRLVPFAVGNRVWGFAYPKR
jgi:hypothetical protein